MPTRRLFVALTLPDAVRATLAAETAPLPHVAWTPPAQLHLTLRFLGETDESILETLCARLRTVRVAPFLLPVEGVGTFPPNRPPRTLWIGIGSGHPRLFQLRQRLDDALLAAGLTALDLRTFHPHITLARATEPATKAVAHWLHTHRGFAAPPFRVTSFALLSSALHPDGAVHTLLERFPLAD
jgi:2'-5' RNA ligase